MLVVFKHSENCLYSQVHNGRTRFCLFAVHILSLPDSQFSRYIFFPPHLLEVMSESGVCSTRHHHERPTMNSDSSSHGCLAENLLMSAVPGIL